MWTNSPLWTFRIRLITASEQYETKGVSRTHVVGQDRRFQDLVHHYWGCVDAAATAVFLWHRGVSHHLLVVPASTVLPKDSSICLPSPAGHFWQLKVLVHHHQSPQFSLNLLVPLPSLFFLLLSVYTHMHTHTQPFGPMSQPPQALAWGPENMSTCHTTEETVFMVELHTDIPSHLSHPFPTNSLTSSAYSQLPAFKKYHKSN